MKILGKTNKDENIMNIASKNSILSLVIVLMIAGTCIQGCTEQKPVPGTIIDEQPDTQNIPSPSYTTNPGYTLDDARSVNQALLDTIQHELDIIDTGLSNDTAALAKTGLLSEQSLGLIRGVKNHSPYIQSPVLLDTNLKIIAVGSEEYPDIIGSDLSDQPHLNEVLRLKNPVMGNLTSTVEGIPAIPVSYPILVNGSVTGILSILIEQKEIFADAILISDRENRFEEFIMQPDGLILYDKDSIHTGKNIHTEPLYAKNPSFKEIAYRIGDERTGTGTYQMQNISSTNIFTKEAIWNTTGIHGGEWRVVVSRITT
ncbi:hypothetical protein DLD82_04025 [Methanospirillum stamsii]|uniref:Dret-0059-like sensor domain-containing protein n=2 Tax=Methanospirillum stamsii TaxID=1277351 RepID=A0A2V2NH75_9EURY|nr:hypothetical protein DLD82_04025 [Methanospirillum stamsii]